MRQPCPSCGTMIDPGDDASSDDVVQCLHCNTMLGIIEDQVTLRILTTEEIEEGIRRHPHLAHILSKKN